ncbi:nectin-3 [Rhinichthys klamathensis goyatoka]|uniref:nectin-3 n=1 Tax=Rhinichthys klamathensis goyatoka TaxID=3034132 RepID=UPI0024B52B8D|nr:nectin-3 [Rhinichthys klamathensis goyatoka]
MLDFILFSIIYARTSGVKVIGHDTTVIYGDNATLLCQLTETDDSITRIIWMKKTRENPEEKTFFAIWPGDKTEHQNGLGDRVQFIGKIAEKNGSIQLLRMRFLDEGIYTCVFNLFPSGTFETDINATVFARPVVNVKGEAPATGYLEATLASCFASNAWPAPAVTWRLGDLENSLKTETNHTVHPNNRTITVVSYLLGVPSKHFNKKNVQCVVKHNTLREDLVMNYTINIHYPPESVVIIPDSPTNAKEFKCIVDSNPEPTIYTWTRVNKSTPYFKDNKLPVPKLSPDFNGLYICHASNQYGSSAGSMYVNVHTESSTVCWGLFGSFTIVALLGAVGVVILKTKPEWIQVPRRSNDEAQQHSSCSFIEDADEQP